MKVITALVGALILIHAIPAHAEVRRHDKPAAAYQPSAAPSYLIDMPHEGSGILVAPNWVATVAHTIFYDYVGKTIEIGGQPTRWKSWSSIPVGGPTCLTSATVTRPR
ncbi:hypothetical protein [Kordiimonas gwangyangensis]|uniref:hypothetical protein n=1 Tax=Kordiimonas gwangyangensis TaxID=288022 RepID=UPI000AF59368|nr:hypothetical protein [Kordiimonas gwangyangensis]